MSGRPLGLLAAGAVAGAAVAALGLRAPRPTAAPLPPDVLARVNGVPITRATYQAALAAVAGDRRDHAAAPALRRHVLDRLIDEELLVQRGLALGLVRLDPRVRADLVAAVLAEIDAAAELEAAPDDAALAALHAAEPERFGGAPRVAVSTAWFAGADGEARAAAARATATDAAGWDRVRAGTAPAPVRVPVGPVPAGTLLDVLGPTATRAALTLPVGAVSAPVVTSGGAWLLRVEARAPGGPRPLADVRPEVEAEWRRRAGDRRLRATLDDERRAAEVAFAHDLDVVTAAAARDAPVGGPAGEPDVDEIPSAGPAR